MDNRYSSLIARYIMILFSVVIFGIPCAIAQKYLPGYIITLKGDTVRGFIGDGTDAELESVLPFKASLRESAITLYTSSTILGFGFDSGRKYKRFSFSKGETNTGDSLYVLAKEVVIGKVNLYTWERSPKNEPDIFLINNASHRTVHLTEPEKENRMTQNGNQFETTSTKHIGLIRSITADLEHAPASLANLRYHEKGIKNEIQKYNRSFENDFPMSIYYPTRGHFNEVTFGLTPTKNDGSAFRLAAYRNVFFPEKSRTWSMMMGFSYRYWKGKLAPVNPGVKQDNTNYEQQIVSLIPIGINFHGSGKFIRPYVYAGVGLTLLFEKNRNVTNGVDMGSKNELYFSPLTVNIGAGLKIKVGSNYLLAEVTPTLNNAGVFCQSRLLLLRERMPFIYKVKKVPKRGFRQFRHSRSATD